MEIFIIFAFYGILASGIYLIFCFLRRLINYNVVLQIPLDILCGLIVGLIFYYCTINYALGIIRLHLVLAFILGFVVSLITFKNFVATISDFVYNIIKRCIIKLIAKIKLRRNANERRKTNQNS